MSLPEIEGQVAIPEYFSPSRLSGALQCRLRAVAEGSWPRLPAGPAAAVGSAFHRLLEEAQRGLFANDYSRPAITVRLGEILADQEQSLSRNDDTAHFVPLSETVSRVNWVSRSAGVVRQAQLLAEPTRQRGAARRVASAKRPRGIEDLPDGTFPELSIVSHQSRLRGKIDSLEKKGSTYVVRDHKTGSVTEPDLSIRQHIAEQLRFYGVALLDNCPEAQVRLVVNAGREHEVSFGPTEVAQTRRTLQETLSALPATASVDSDTLANPGEACRFCTVRPSCGAYRGTAPSWWARAGASPIPVDTWGQVAEGRADDDGLRSVRLRDESGRWIKITGLAGRHPDIVPSRRAMFFGLGHVADARRSGERYRHPQNFHEIPKSDNQRRAWTLKVFAER